MAESRVIACVRQESQLFGACRILLALGGLALLWTTEGCARPRRPIFEPIDPPIVWPARPAQPRIRYVGALHSSEDLKAPRGLMRSLGDVLTGPPEALRLYGPRALLCTAGGQRVWIADLGGRCLYVFDLAERSCRRLRQFGDQPLMAPVDVCLGPGGTIYLCDAQQAAVHQIMENTGDWIATLRLPEDIERPVAITYREAKDELYVVDVKAHDIKVLTSDGSLLRLLGGRGASPGTFNFPSDVVDDGQSLWVVDTGNHRVQRLGYDGAPLLIIGQEGDAPGDLAMPKSVALDSEGHAYVVDARFENVQLFDQQGRLLLFFGEEGIGPGQFWLPAGVFIDSRDRIWVCDSYNARVQVFQYLKPQAASDDAVRDEPRIR